jgi:p-aminobenzoyl-glutamate transporter AbgT
MNKTTVITILVILAYLFIKIHQQYDDRSTIGICSMIVVYVLAFEISSLLFSDIPKFID